MSFIKNGTPRNGPSGGVQFGVDALESLARRFHQLLRRKFTARDQFRLRGCVHRREFV